MKKMALTVAAVLACVTTLFATQYSRLALKTAAQKYGKWDALVTWLKAANMYDDFLIANNLSDEYPQFPLVTNALVQAGIATSAEIEQILSESVDTAVPDTALMAKYNRDMQTPTGRQAWHGKHTTWIDTNACERVYLYEDGYRYVEKWQRPQSEIERRIAQAKALVAAAERSAANKPLPVRSVIVKRAQIEALILTNAANRVIVNVKTGEVVDKDLKAETK